MENYCNNPNCNRRHCRWGNQGQFKKHETKCYLKHCYKCYSHKLPKDEQEFVISWFCSEDCKKEYNLANTNK